MKWKRRYIKKKRELAVLRTDCKEGLGEWWNTWKQTMSDKMGLSRRNLLHCDGVYLPAASSLCPCGLVQRVVRHVHYVSCYLFVPSAAVTICMCHISDTLHKITAPVQTTQIELLLSCCVEARLKARLEAGFCCTCHVFKKCQGILHIFLTPVIHGRKCQECSSHHVS